LGGKERSWLEIIASGPAAVKDEVVSLLISAGSGAVVEGVLSAASPPVGAPGAGFGAELRAALPATWTEDIGRLREVLLHLGWSMTTSTTIERDWSLAWRQGLRPVRVSRRGPPGDKGRGDRGTRGILVHASWSGAVARPGEVEVIMDPSMAFGTGTHPTTKMCMRALLWLPGGPEGPLAGGTMLDVGTGTGILMIAALKLGAVSAVGLDIDPTALKVARRNLSVNNVTARLGGRPLSRVRGKFSIITANIFSEELRRLAPRLVARLGRGPSFLVLSGMLREQVDGVVSAYSDLGLGVVKRFVDHEWACVVLGRKGQRGLEGTGEVTP